MGAARAAVDFLPGDGAKTRYDRIDVKSRLLFNDGDDGAYVFAGRRDRQNA